MSYLLNQAICSIFPLILLVSIQVIDFYLSKVESTISKVWFVIICHGEDPFIVWPDETGKPFYLEFACPIGKIGLGCSLIIHDNFR